MPEFRECVKCGCIFEFRLGKSGKINECWDCADGSVERIAGSMAWEGKCTPVLITFTREQEDDWIRTHRRVGATVSSGVAKPSGVVLDVDEEPLTLYDSDNEEGFDCEDDE